MFEFIFIGFEFSLPENLYDSNEQINSIEKLSLLSYNRELKHLEIINNIIKYERGFQYLKKGKIYLYDDRLNNN